MFLKIDYILFAFEENFFVINENKKIQKYKIVFVIQYKSKTDIKNFLKQIFLENS